MSKQTITNLRNNLFIGLIITCCGVNSLQMGFDTASIDIIPRKEWNAREPLAKQNLTEYPAPFVVVHHSETANCLTKEACKRLVKAFQNFHMDTRKWDDVGYNFIIGEDGNIYEGRGWGIKGGHAKKYNARSIGICIIGTFVDHLPNDKAIHALKQLINYAVVTGEIKHHFKLIGHRQAAATECPGQKFFEFLQTWTHWVPVAIDERR